MTKRGEYKSETRGRQLIRFDGCQIPGTNITPTDIDAIIECHDKMWFLVEVKLEGVQVNDGQDFLIRRFIADMQKAGKPSLGIIAEHDINDSSKDIYLKDCRIRELYYYDNVREKVITNYSPYKDINSCIDAFRRHIGCGGEFL